MQGLGNFAVLGLRPCNSCLSGQMWHSGIVPVHFGNDCRRGAHQRSTCPCLSVNMPTFNCTFILPHRQVYHPAESISQPSVPESLVPARLFGATWCISADLASQSQTLVCDSKKSISVAQVRIRGSHSRPCVESRI